MQPGEIKEPRELTLCRTISAVTETALRDELAGTPLYEVEWYSTEKQSSWTPALSLIPVSRKSTFRPNVHVYQQIRVRDVETPLYTHFEGFTPRDDTVIISGIEIGAVLDYPVSAGFIILAGKGWTQLDYHEGGSARKNNPVAFLMKTEGENAKKSKIFVSFAELASGSQYTATIRLGPRGIYNLSYPAYFLLAPRGNQTVAMASTCACPPRGFKEKLTVPEGYSINYEFGPPSDKVFQNAVSLVRAVMRLAEMAKSVEHGSAQVPNLSSELMLYLLLESVRRANAAQNERLSFRDVFSPNPSEAISTLFSVLPEGKDIKVVEGKVHHKEPGPATVQLKCPSCGAVYTYGPQHLLPDGQVKCQNCFKVFGGQPS